MSLEINTAIARAAWEARRSYIAATAGPDEQGVAWNLLSRDGWERERIRVITYLQNGDEGAGCPSPAWLVWAKVVEVMRQALGV